MLQIYLLGSFRPFDHGAPHKFSTLPRTLSLWAYVLLHPGAVARDRLAAHLWPEVSTSVARANLRRHLHDLRCALPPTTGAQPWLRTEDEIIQWKSWIALSCNTSTCRPVKAAQPNLAHLFPNDPTRNV
jgi:DNA-binding SARP family transcriptional activator